MTTQMPVKPIGAAMLVFTSTLFATACGSETSEPAIDKPSSVEGTTPGQSGGAGASGSPHVATTQTAGTPAIKPPRAAGNAAAGASGGAGTAANSGGSVSEEDAGVTDGPGVPTNPAPLSGRTYPIMQQYVGDAPAFHITRPTDLGVSGGLLPVIVWANGGCLRTDIAWAPLFERWAQAGFVVLSLTGAGGEDDLASMFDMTTKTEHRALVDWVVNANESGPLAGALDLKRIVAAGNSCGGVTALELTAEDERIAAVFVLSGSSAIGSADTEIMEAVSVPVGYITGSESDDVAAPNAAADYEAMRDGVPAMLMQRTSGDHLTVSSDAMILPENAEIAVNWLDLALYGTSQALDTLSAPTKVCATCTPDVWKLKSKHLDSLVK